MPDLLHPYGDLDVLGRYGKIAPYLNNFLKKKEIASKIIGPNFVLLKRGTQNKPLFIENFKDITENFLQLRAKHHLDEMRSETSTLGVKDQLTPTQILLRQYFVPRKLINFFYACNNEYGNSIDRIFIDIDRQNNSADDARKATLELVKTIKSDKKFSTTLGPDRLYRLLTLWTGSSFHVLLMLKKNIDHKFYDAYLSYGQGKENSFPCKRAEQISQATKLKVAAGHARQKDTLILDTSNTPPGKLARAPFSLHIKNSETYDGICVPVSEQDLANPKLISKLQKLTPELIWKNINKYAELLNI